MKHNIFSIWLHIPLMDALIFPYFKNLGKEVHPLAEGFKFYDVCVVYLMVIVMVYFSRNL